MKMEALEAEFRLTEQDIVEPFLFLSEEIATWATQAEEEAAIRANLIRDSEELTVKAGDTAVALPSLLYDIQYVECQYPDGTTTEVFAKDRGTLDQERPGWRAETCRPQDYIHDDKQMVLGGIAEADCTLYVEFYRRPKKALSAASDVPEIAAVHHLNLLDWVRYRAYLKPDIDTQDNKRALAAEASFTAYFGRRKTADLRRAQNAVVPHRNRVHL